MPQVVNGEALESACMLLGLDKVRLCAALTQRRIITPSEIVTRLLKEDEAREVRALWIMSWVILMTHGS